MQNKLVIWATALVVALGSMAGLAVRTAQAQTAPLPLVISAVQITGGEGASSQDFIELYNPNPFPVDLNGYRIVKRSTEGTADASVKSFSTETLIPAYSFYLWANSTWTTIGVVPDTATSATLANDNGVGLRYGALDSGTLVDSVSWGTATNGFVASGLANPGANESIVRQDLFENLGYLLAPSDPRNSSSQQLPEELPVQVDDASCTISPAQLSVKGGQVSAVGISFDNNGNTTWDAAGYSVRQLAPSGSTEVALGSAVNPMSKLDLNVQVTAPSSAGQFSFQWQMQKGEVLFGSSCLLNLSVTPDEPDPEPVLTTIRITELLPNPSGEDAGKEMVELYNYGSEPIDLESWVLDDIQSWPASTNAHVIGALEVAPGQQVVITIPEGKFGLNNTGGDTLTLFSPTGSTVSSVAYGGTAPENKSYSLVGGEWHWAAPSMGVVNPPLPEESEDDPPAEDEEPEDNDENEEVDLSGLVISEVYAAPVPSQKEFLELFNGSPNSIDLEDVRLAIGNRTTSLPEAVMLPGSYLVLQDKDLKLPLADSGKVVQLVDKESTLIDEVEYPKARKGESYSLFEDGFLWTVAVTPGAVNQFVAAHGKVELKQVKVTTSGSKAASTNNAVNANTDPPKAVQEPAEQEDFQEMSKSGETKPKSKPFNVLVIGLASLGAGILAIYKYGFGGF